MTKRAVAIESCIRLVTAATLGLICAGCTWMPVAHTDRSILNTPDAVEASGGASDDFFGLHFIRTVSLLTGEKETLISGFEPVLETKHGDWGLVLLARRGTSDFEALPDSTAVQSAFSNMADALTAMFPDNKGRRFSIYLVPPDAAFSGTWWSIALHDDQVTLHFAFRAPAHGDDEQWAWRLVQMLAHEYSHSYFWFRPKWFTTRYVDEIVAYSVQRCVHVELTTSSTDTLDSGFRPFFNLVASLDPVTLYERYRTSYPDTYLGNVAAEQLFRRFLRAHGDHPSLDDVRTYCAQLVKGEAIEGLAGRSD